MKTLTYHFVDETILATACLSWIKGGGLFFKNVSDYDVGESLKVEMRVVNDDGISFIGQVVWLSPKHERDQWPEGIGVQFVEEDAKKMRTYLENIVPDVFAKADILVF